MRPAKSEGIDYHFVDNAEFERLIETDEFAEWAYVFDHLYGSPKEPIKEALKDGRDTLFDIDWQGTQQLEYAFPHRPGHGSSFCRRRCASWSAACTSAGPTAKRSSPSRMKRASGEIGHWAEYDYVLINEDMDECLGDVRAIIAAERLRRERQPYLLDFVRELVGPQH